MSNRLGSDIISIGHEQIPKRVFGFVDSDNVKLSLANSLRKRGVPESYIEHFDLIKLLRAFCLDRYYFYSAVKPLTEAEPWLQEIRSTENFIFREAVLKDVGTRVKQEGVDVQLAVEAMQCAFKKTMRSCVIFSDDGDLLPLVNALVAEGIHTIVASHNNPAKSDVASRLRDSSDQFIHIGSKILWHALKPEHSTRSAGGGYLDTLLQSGSKCELELENYRVPAVRHEDGTFTTYRLVAQDVPEDFRLNYRKFGSEIGAKLWHILHERMRS